jgi:peroxiredoxin
MCMCAMNKSGMVKGLMLAVLGAGIAVGSAMLLTGKPAVADGAKSDGKAEPKAGVTIGGDAPTFTLKDTDGKELNFAEFSKGKTVVLEWFNPECPFVVKQYVTTSVMADTRAVAKETGALWLTINSGAAGKQGAGLEKNKQFKTDWKIENPVLIDDAGTVGKAYGARTTPHMYIIKDGKVVYMGAIDNNRSAREKGDKNFVIQALRELKDGKAVSEAETRPYGCSVKY